MNVIRPRIALLPDKAHSETHKTPCRYYVASKIYITKHYSDKPSTLRL